MLSFRFVAHSEVLGRICCRLKNALCFFCKFESKTWFAENLFLTSYIGVYTR